MILFRYLITLKYFFLFFIICLDFTSANEINLLSEKCINKKQIEKNISFDTLENFNSSKIINNPSFENNLQGWFFDKDAKDLYVNTKDLVLLTALLVLYVLDSKPL